MHAVCLWRVALQEDPAKALSDAERLKRQRMEEEESERSQRLLMEQVGAAGR
jgi:CHASE3 domain sensor protein